MGSIGGPEVLVILVVALLVLGPSRLPDAARQAGRVIGDLRRVTSGFQAEMRDAFAEHESGTTVSPPPPSAGVPVDRVPAVDPGASAHVGQDRPPPPDGPSFI